MIPGRAAVRRTIRAGTNIIGEPSGVVFRRSALLQAGAFDDGLPYMIDLDMWTRMLAFGDLAVVNAPLYAFRVSSRGLSTSIGWGQHKQWCAFVDRVRANPDLGVTRADAWRGKSPFSAFYGRTQGLLHDRWQQPEKNTNLRMTHFRWKFPDIAFFTTLALLLALMPLLSFDFGITWDEYFHQAYGKKVLRFYTSGFTNDSAMRYFVMHLYGGFYDLLTTLVVKALRVFHEYDVRHMVNAAFGWLAVFSAGMLARKLFNAWAGLAAVLLLVITPRFFAHCMNNPKDIPFAAMFMLSLYALSFMRERYPYVNRKNCLFMIGAIALTLNIRVGGLLLLAYAGGWLSVQMFFRP